MPRIAMCEVRMLLRRYTLVNGKEKTIMKLSKILLMLCVVAIVGVAVLTAVQTVYASPIPPGCWQTQYRNDCVICSWIDWNGRTREIWKWKCPNGAYGSAKQYQPCYSCER